MAWNFPDHDIRLSNDTQSDGNTLDEDILIGDDDIVPDDGEEPLGPDKILSQRTR